MSAVVDQILSMLKHLIPMPGKAKRTCNNNVIPCLRLKARKHKSFYSKGVLRWYFSPCYCCFVLVFSESFVHLFVMTCDTCVAVSMSMHNIASDSVLTYTHDSVLIFTGSVFAHGHLWYNFHCRGWIKGTELQSPLIMWDSYLLKIYYFVLIHLCNAAMTRLVAFMSMSKETWLRKVFQLLLQFKPQHQPTLSVHLLIQMVLLQQVP